MADSKNKKWLHLLWIIPVLLIIIGGIYLYARFNDFKQPFITDAKIKIALPQNKKDASVNVKLSLVNPNDISGKIDSIKYKIFIDGKQYGQGRQNEPISIKANDTTQFSLPFEFDFDAFNKNYVKPGVDSGVYKIETTAYTSIWKFEDLKIPYTFEKKMAVIKPLEFEIENISLTKPGLNETKLEATLTLKNLNKIDIVSTENYYEFYVDGERWAVGHLSETIDIPKETQKTITAPIEVSPKDVISETGIFGQKNYKEKKFRATLQSTLKAKNRGGEELQEIKFVMLYDGILGKLINNMKEKREKEESSTKKKKEKKEGDEDGGIKILPGLKRGSDE